MIFTRTAPLVPAQQAGPALSGPSPAVLTALTVARRSDLSTLRTLRARRAALA